MLRKNVLLPLLSFGIAGFALAQQSTPAQTPPQLERIESGSDTPVTITPQQSSKTKIVEKKENGGRVSDVTVTTGKSQYHMKPNTPAGNAQVGDAVSNAVRAPTWQILEFNLNKKKKTEEKEQEPVTPAPANVPPPPSMPANSK